jgi:PncC family amidohydrolase
MDPHLIPRSTTHSCAALDHLTQALHTRLTQKNLTVCCAESCTAGLLGGRFTTLPGSSTYFRGGVIAYADDVKTGLLGVPSRILAHYGAVSRETVTHMLAGVRTCIPADCAIAISGIAGPGGGGPDKPVGLVYIGCTHAQTRTIQGYLFSGSRSAVRGEAVYEALSLLLDLTG